MKFKYIYRYRLINTYMHILVRYKGRMTETGRKRERP